MATTDRISGTLTSVAVKEPVRVATTANITLSGEQTVDGVSVVADDRVLVKDQSDATENGIWVCATGAWSRAVDFNGPYDVVRDTQVLISEGDTYTNSNFVLDTSDPTIGTDSLSFTELAQATGTTDSPTFAGLTVNGNIAVTGTVDGVDIAALEADVDGFPDALKNLTTAEIGQVENIGGTTISATQWGYLGGQDQDLAVGNTPTFSGIVALRYHTRADFVADAGRATGLSAGDIVLAGDLLYEYLSGATDISDLADFVPAGTVTPFHFADNTTPGTTPLDAALQAAAAYLCDTTITDSDDLFHNGRAGEIDLLGQVVATEAPIVVGDVNGTGAGFAYGLRFTNGTVVCLSSGDWSDLESDVPGYAFVVADWKAADQTNEDARLHNIIFDDTLIIDCNYQTGGVFWENTRDCRAHGDVLNVAIGCRGHLTSVGAAADNARGYLTKNTGLLFGGKVASGSGVFGASQTLALSGICTMQTPDGGNNLSIDGSEASGGSWTSPTGGPQTLEIRSTTPYSDGDGTVDVTVTGTSDGSTPLVEAVTLRKNSTQFQATYTAGAFQTVTAVATNGNHNGDVSVAGSMQNGGFKILTPDSYMTDGVEASQMCFALEVEGNGAVQAMNAHFWSREIVIGEVNFWTRLSQCEYDFTDVRVSSQDDTDAPVHISGSFYSGTPRIVLVANQASATGEGITIGECYVDPTRTRNLIDFEAGSGSWVNFSDAVFAKAPDATPNGGDVPIMRAGNSGQFRVLENGRVQVDGALPGYTLRETDGTSTFNQSNIFQTGDELVMQTAQNDGTFVSADYKMAKDASGAVSHSWRIADTEKMLLDGSALTLDEVILDVSGGDFNLLTLTRLVDNNGASNLEFKKSRGTPGSPAVVNAGDGVSSVNSYAYDGSAYDGIAAIKSIAESVSGGDISGKIEIQTADTSGTLQTRLTIDEAGAVDVAEDLSVGGFLNIGTSTELTISSGAVTVTQTHHTIDTESDASTDDLDTINGGSAGDIVIFGTESSGRDITVKHGTGNINCGGSDVLLNTITDKIALVKRGSVWDRLFSVDN